MEKLKRQEKRDQVSRRLEICLKIIAARSTIVPKDRLQDRVYEPLFTYLTCPMAKRWLC